MFFYIPALILKISFHMEKFMLPFALNQNQSFLSNKIIIVFFCSFINDYYIILKRKHNYN